MVTAFTEIACSIIEGADTINSSFIIPVTKRDEATNVPVDFTNKSNKSNFLNKKYNNLLYLLIDEVSMIDAVLFGKIAQTLDFVKKSNKPFGGVHVILFGDIFQLPPVVGISIYTDILNYNNVFDIEEKVENKKSNRNNDPSLPKHYVCILFEKFKLAGHC